MEKINILSAMPAVGAPLAQRSAFTLIFWQGAVDHPDQLQSAAEILGGLSFVLQPLDGALPGAVLCAHDFYNEGCLGHSDHTSLLWFTKGGGSF